ncbi:MAG TPA: hypothetical protein DDZ80_03980 [Cyanobacteria bacterium UBA8803]|nr:hypothetical protein [Cyanobacteria bacterium UBA9273]HBL57721.1 hypothetical protein [Cyanobacteria bacterium UBA8803]
MNRISTNVLTQSWQDRYIPDFSTLSLKENHIDCSKLVELASAQGRAKTVIEIRRLLQLKCSFAEIKNNILFSYIPKVVRLTEALQLARYIQDVYDRALAVYQQQPPLSLPTFHSAAQNNLGKTVDFSSDLFKQWVMPALRLPAVEKLSVELQPIFAVLREHHKSVNDPRTIGFLSTQFHFSTTLVLHQLNLEEQLLLSPYFKFVEEQVCIPWQRVCNAAAKQMPDSPNLTIVQRLLPVSQEIAINVHRRAAQLYPNHNSRRGELNHPGVKASSIRDIEMFQAYLWLCVLEESMTAVEEELLPLCVMVFPSIDVEWQLVEQILPMLMDEFKMRLNSEQISFLQPYTQAMQQVFSKPQGLRG